jgi:heme a synthase
MSSLTTNQLRGLPYVQAWLYAIAVLVFCMVIVGGATRLTDSGLSITEWKPLLGVIPPLTEADWLEAFEKYKLIPEYITVNAGMTLDEFKFIYWWEWSHRFLGRVIGLAFLVPFVIFAGLGWIARPMWPRLIGLFVLGGLQGALGWYMVASGLVDRVDVSQYRLSAHLTLATIIFAAILWVAFGLNANRAWPSTSRQRWAVGIVALIVFQVAAGGLVAGLDAGMGYNTWPLMDGKLVPDGLFIMAPAWRNLFENAITVQFNHRLIAYVIVIVAVAYAYLQRSRESLLVLGAVLLQAAIGIVTLLAQVPLSWGLIHQGGALVVLSAALWNLHTVLRRSPAPDRQ